MEIPKADMSKKVILVTRLKDNGVNTLTSVAVSGTNIPFKIFPSLELPWKNNLPEVSCIPARVYSGEVRYSKKYGRHIHIKGVPGRSLILFHWGNFTRDTLGCILIGSNFKDIDGDGQMDVTASRKAFSIFMSLFRDDDEIEIRITPAIIHL